MDNFFDPDSPVMAFLADAADLIIANILFILTSIPIVTLGASTAALYSVVRVPGEKRYSASVFRNYFSAFARNFKKATLAFLILLVPSGLAAANILLAAYGLLGSSIPAYVICGLSIFLCSFVWSYTFPLIAGFDSTVGKSLSNALVLSISHLPVTIAVVALDLLPVLILIFQTELFFKLAMVWLFFGFALIAWINSRLLGWVFKYYSSNT